MSEKQPCVYSLINIDEYMIHTFQTFHPLRLGEYPLLSTNLLNPDAAAIDIPSTLPILDVVTTVCSITATFPIHSWLLLVHDSNSDDLPLRKIFTNYGDVFMSSSSCRTVILSANTRSLIRLWFHYVHTTTTLNGVVRDSYYTSEAILDLSCPRCATFMNHLSQVSPRHWFSVYSVWRLTTAESPTTIVLHI